MKVFSLLLAVFNYFDERVQLCMFFLILFLQHYCSSFYEVSCISKSVIWYLCLVWKIPKWNVRLWTENLGIYKYSSQSLSVVLAKSLQCLEVSFFWWGEGGVSIISFHRGRDWNKIVAFRDEVKGVGMGYTQI